MKWKDFSVLVTLFYLYGKNETFLSVSLVALLGYIVYDIFIFITAVLIRANMNMVSADRVDNDTVFKLINLNRIDSNDFIDKLICLAQIVTVWNDIFTYLLVIGLIVNIVTKRYVVDLFAEMMNRRIEK